MSLDVTPLLRPFFWLMVTLLAVAPLVIALSRQPRPHRPARS